MPIYEYLCADCETEFEHLVRSAADERGLRCVKCGGKKIERKLSVIAAPRAGAGKTAMPLPKSPCGRCGDPNGSCARE